MIMIIIKTFQVEILPISSLNDLGTQERGPLGVKPKRFPEGARIVHGPVPLELPPLALIRA